MAAPFQRNPHGDKEMWTRKRNICLFDLKEHHDQIRLMSTGVNWPTKRDCGLFLFLTSSLQASHFPVMRAVCIKMVLRILVCHLLGLPASEQSHYSSLTPFSLPTSQSCELGWGYSYRYCPHQYLLGFGLSSYWMYHPREWFVHDTGDPWSSLRPVSFLFQMSL